MSRHRRNFANIFIILCVTATPIGIFAKPSASKQPIESAGVPAALPPAKKRVAFDKKTIEPVRLSAENVAKDPNQLVRFFEQNPDKLVVSTMPPELVLTVSQLLIQARSWLLAERLMFDAIKKWPNRNTLRQRYGRILIQLGRPKAARRYLKPVLTADTSDAVSQFLYGLASWRMTPRTADIEREARESFNKVLSLAPSFQDISGWTASDIRRQLNRNSTGTANRPSAP